MTDEYVKEIPSREKDFPEWYTAVCLRAELVDYTPVRGMMVIRPYGYAIWEGVQRWLDGRFKATGHVNAYFPLLYPESFLQREAEHVQGFAPQVAWVTQGGEEELEERLVIRPTSEAIMMPMYAKWIQSYRDLPLLIIQWNNVVRWEKATRPFLRTREFLWHEGHTAHRSHDEANAECLLILDIYREFVETVLAIPVLAGRKPASEKFAGADETYTLEALMPDSQAIQAGTSHFLGQNFGKAFDVKFLDADNQEKFVWTTSWAISTRIIGALVMQHGDDRGLVLPPAIAPYQVVIVPILGKDGEAVQRKANEVASRLADKFRVKLDDREQYTPGWKFNDWEMRGVPLRVEIGPRDVSKGQVVLARRTGGDKASVPESRVVDAVDEALGEIQQELLGGAQRFMAGHIGHARSLDDLAAQIEARRGFVKVGWCGAQSCEDAMRDRTGASPRVIPLDDRPDGVCVVCGRTSTATVYYARAY